MFQAIADFKAVQYSVPSRTRHSVLELQKVGQAMGGTHACGCSVDTFAMRISGDSTRDLSDKDLTLMAQCHGQKTTGRSFDFWRHTNDSPFENNSQTQEDEQIDTIRTNTSYML